MPTKHKRKTHQSQTKDPPITNDRRTKHQRKTHQTQPKDPPSTKERTSNFLGRCIPLSVLTGRLLTMSQTYSSPLSVLRAIMCCEFVGSLANWLISTSLLATGSSLSACPVRKTYKIVFMQYLLRNVNKQLFLRKLFTSNANK